MNTPPTNIDDIIDSRDVIERIEELDAELPDSPGEVMPGTSEELEEIRKELAILRDLAKEGEGSPDWPHGEQLIRDSYFEKYAQELAEDCGALTARTEWPNNCIDWAQAARELQEDYMGVEFDGVDYWIRA